MPRLLKDCMSIQIQFIIKMYNITICLILKNVSAFSVRIFQLLLKQMGFTYVGILKICIQMDMYVELNLHREHSSGILKYSGSILGQVLA